MHCVRHTHKYIYIAITNDSYTLVPIHFNIRNLKIRYYNIWSTSRHLFALGGILSCAFIALQPELANHVSTVSSSPRSMYT